MGLAAICSMTRYSKPPRGEEALEADHAPGRPDFVRAVAVGGDEIGLRARDGVGQDRVNGAVAGLVLLRVEALALQPLGRGDGFLGGGHVRLLRR